MASRSKRKKMRRDERLPPTMPDGRPIVAVVDTNVMLDINSVHDIDDAIAVALEGADFGAARRDKRVEWRRQRARDGLLLAIHFDSIGACTYGLYEVVAMLERVAPPTGEGGRTLFVSMFTHFTQPNLLCGWDQAFPNRRKDQALRGRAADQALMDYAKKHSLPLITNEGFTQDGIVDQKMRAEAKSRGIAVFTPGEFIAGKVDCATAGEAFLARYRQKAWERIAATPHGEARVTATSNFERVSAYYRFLLGLETGDA